MTFQIVHEFDGIIDSTRREWNNWLICADEFYKKYTSRLNGQPPFEGRKSQAVDFLSNSAALSGYVPIIGRETSALSPLRYPLHKSRSDLWFDSGQQEYFFKFRQTRRDLSVPYLNLCLQYIMFDLDILENPHRGHLYSCIISVAHSQDSHESCIVFSENVDATYRIGPEEKPAFLFFKQKD
jgi:hypothetical protein